MSNLFEFPLPDIGEGVAEGEIVQWMVAEGDAVKEDQEIVEVMTDKATVPITSPVAGKVKKIVAAAGAVVPVGSILLAIEPAAGAHIPTVASHGTGASHGHGGGHAAPAATPGKSEAPTATATAIPTAEPDFVRPDGQRALATPYTRKMAREAGVDIERIRGTGEVGRVTPDDVRRFADSRKGAAAPAAAPSHDAHPSLSEQAAAYTEAPTLEFVPPAPIRDAKPAAEAAPKPAAHVAAPLPAVSGEREERIPIRGLRKKISERMHQSKSTAAHFTYVDDFDATPLVELRSQLKGMAAERGAKLTFLPFLMKAIVSAMRRFPTLNGVTDDARQEFVVKRYHNYGIAVDTDSGLIVPVVKDVDRRSILDLAAEIERLSKDAREGKSKLDDLKDGTFTITNAGNIGGLFATPVINYPEAAICGVHAIKRAPRVVRDAAGAETIAVRDVMYLSVSIDHRMNDGATGARWMNHVISLLSDPSRLMLEM